MCLSLAIEELTNAYQRAKLGMLLLGHRQNGNMTPVSGFHQQGVPRNGIPALLAAEKMFLTLFVRQGNFHKKKSGL